VQDALAVQVLHCHSKLQRGPHHKKTKNKPDENAIEAVYPKQQAAQSTYPVQDALAMQVLHCHGNLQRSEPDHAQVRCARIGAGARAEPAPQHAILQATAECSIQNKSI
jgi:Holliday junction resolvasome RuvABC endonuclease subunit